MAIHGGVFEQRNLRRSWLRRAFLVVGLALGSWLALSLAGGTAGASDKAPPGDPGDAISDLVRAPASDTAAPLGDAVGAVVRHMPSPSELAAPTIPAVETTIPVVEPVVAPVVDAVVEPVVVPVVEPVVAPVVAPVVDAVVEPVVAPVVDAVVEPVVAPVVDAVVEPVVAPVVDAVVEPVVAPVVDAVLEPVVAPVVDAVLEPVVAPVVDAVLEPVVAPVVDAVLEPVGGAVAADMLSAVPPTIVDSLATAPARASTVSTVERPVSTPPAAVGASIDLPRGPSAPDHRSTPQLPSIPAPAGPTTGGAGPMVARSALLPTLPDRPVVQGFVSTTPVETLEDGSRPEPSFSPD